jgi:peptide/nickel transport system substrate-binding protein
MVENQGPPHLEKMVYNVIPDATTQLAALQSGDVDVLFVNRPAHRQQLAEDESVKLEEALLSSLVYLGFNCQKPPFDEVAVRQALSHAVDKEEIVNVALDGMGKRAFAPLPPAVYGFDPSLKEYELTYDPEKAKELLREAGFEQTDDGAWARDGEPLQGTLLTSTRAPNEAIATLLQSQLQAIGVPMEIQQLDARAVMQATGEGQFDFLLWRYDWNDPSALNIFLSSQRIGRSNRVAYGNPEVDALLEEGVRELDKAARKEIYVEAQQMILQDAPWQPLYNPVSIIAISERIEGAEVGYMGRLLVNDARVIEQ